MTTPDPLTGFIQYAVPHVWGACKAAGASDKQIVAAIVAAIDPKIQKVEPRPTDEEIAEIPTKYTRALRRQYARGQPIPPHLAQSIAYWGLPEMRHKAVAMCLAENVDDEVVPYADEIGRKLNGDWSDVRLPSNYQPQEVRRYINEVRAATGFAPLNADPGTSGTAQGRPAPP